MSQRAQQTFQLLLSLSDSEMKINTKVLDTSKGRLEKLVA